MRGFLTIDGVIRPPWRKLRQSVGSAAGAGATSAALPGFSESVRLVLLIVLLALPCALAAAAAADPCPGGSDGCTLVPALGNSSAAGDAGQGILRQPQALALDGGGNLLVGDRWSYAIQRFDGARQWTGAWGEYGDEPGQFAAVGGLAVDDGGALYALDIEHNRVQKFVPDGGGYRLATTWGGRGSNGRGASDFDIRFKGDIAIGPGSRIYVADTYNHRVAWYDSDGRYLGQLGETDVPGSDAAHLRYPQGLDAGPDGTIYIADDRNDRVQKFSPAGVLLASIGSSAELNFPYDVGVDAGGNVYVADNLNHRIVKYAPDAAGVAYSLAGTWGGRGDGPGQMLTPRSILVGPDGTNIVADTGNGRIEAFDANGALLPDTPFGLNGRDGGRLTGPMGLSLHPAGDLLVADALQYRVERLTVEGASVGDWGGHGSSPDELWLAEGVAAAPDGSTWVADTGNDRLQHFDAAGNLTGVVGGFSAPRGLAVDGAGNVFVADTGAARVVKLDAVGTEVAAWTAGGALRAPGDVAVRADGLVVVVDAGADRVFELDGSGALLGDWGGTGANDIRPGPSGFAAPGGLALDGAGNVYVADSGTARVSKFAPDGTWLASWGERGHAPGKFWAGGPRDVVVSGDGTIFASDPYANEVERFRAAGADAAPAVVPGRSWDVGSGSAAVGGAVAARGLRTSQWVEWGPTTAYGSRAVAAGNGGGQVGFRLRDLAAACTYYYRVVAASAAGLTRGPRQTVRTARALNLRVPPQRASTAGRRGVTLKVRAGEMARALVEITVSRATARRLGLRRRGRTVVVARRSVRAARNHWTTVHVRLRMRSRAGLVLTVRSRVTQPAGSAIARLRLR